MEYYFQTKLVHTRGGHRGPEQEGKFSSYKQKKDSTIYFLRSFTRNFFVNGGGWRGNRPLTVSSPGPYKCNI